MDIVVDSSDLTTALTWVRAAVPSHPRMPVLAGVVISAQDGGAQFVGFDYETSRRARVPARTNTLGDAILVPCADLARVSAGFGTGKPVSISSTAAGRVTVACGSMTGTVPLLPVEDYPVVPSIPAAVGRIDAGDLAAVITHVQYAAARDAAVPCLAGIELHTDTDTLRVCATDRYRAASSATTWDNDRGLPRILVPRKPLVAAAKHLARTGTVHIGIDDSCAPSMLSIAGPGYQATIRLIDDHLPNVAVAIPSGFAGDVGVNRKDLLGIVKRLAKLSERRLPIHLSTYDSTMTVATHAGQDVTATQQLPCRSGRATSVALDPAYLEQALAAATTADVVFRYAVPHMTYQPDVTTRSKLGLILDSGTFRAVLMPMRVD
ncbi:MAG: DNA polymerase III subunit beta [Stackebrandtia sp.]